jgi:tetratricopeptide (TPR) repeat protein
MSECRPAPDVRARGVLLPWQRRVYTFVVIPLLGLMAANAIYLLAFTRISSFYMTMLLVHLVAGITVVVPFAVFAGTHAPRMMGIRNRRAKAAGLTIAALALACAITGVIMVFKGATLNNRVVYLIHVFSIPLALVAFILHRRAAVHQLHLRRLFQWGGAVAGFLVLMGIAHKLEKPSKRIANMNGDTQFFLSSAETWDGGLMDGAKLANNQYCGQSGCHPDSLKRWEKGAHRFTSFNNPFYRRAVELMADTHGREKTKWCAGCHDPVVLFTGQMGKAKLKDFSYDQVEGQQSLTCMACHSIVDLKDKRGNGGYVIEESKQYPFAFTKSKWLMEVNKLLIRMEPSLHRQTFLKEFMKTPEFCATCHKVGLLPPLNEYRWLRGQNHYDSWYDSGVSGLGVRSFYDPPQPKQCRDCHLPPYESTEFGARGGKLHDHLFPAAATHLATMRNDPEAMAGIRKILEKSLSVDIFAVRRGGKLVPLGPELPALRPGEAVDVEVVIRTRTLGHPFTQGTSDSNEAWVAFAAANGERKLMESGTLDEAGRLDPAADRLWQLVLGHDGEQVDRRQPNAIHVPLYNNQIPPGADRVVHYRFTVPKDAMGSVTLSAAVNYRKASRDYSIFVGGPDALTLPVVTITADSVTLPVASASAPAADAVLARDVQRGNPDWPEKSWIRFNDYGIGLLLQGDLKGASAIFANVTEMAADKPDGPLNLARAKVQEGDLPGAKAALAEAERRKPGWAKTAFFRAIVSKEEGRVDDAMADLQLVEKKFPKDRNVLNQMARLLYVEGKYADALPFIDRVLDIDGEDLTAHYNAMLCLKAVGRTQEAAAEEKWYRYFKDDEQARSLAVAFRQKNPIANRESQPVHVHDDPFPPRAEVPAWMAEIGPKGYAYKGTPVAGERMLADDRPQGALRPFAKPKAPEKTAHRPGETPADAPIDRKAEKGGERAGKGQS